MEPQLNQDNTELAFKIKELGKEFGFDRVGIADIELIKETDHFKNWVKANFHGGMKFFERHYEVYKSPKKLLPSLTRVICCRMEYPRAKNQTDPIASFAQVQDYSLHIRAILKKYAAAISELINVEQNTRVFAGNAPLLEKALAAKAGIGWYGKNSILIDEKKGSYFFLGEILTDLSLPIDGPVKNRCGTCFKCGDLCPTNAIVAPYKIDARRCIAYLTVEHKGSIPLELRPLIGNKIYGCDICQQVCPWNKKPQNLPSSTFTISEEYSSGNLVDWFLWDKKTYKEKTKDSPMYRLKYDLWLRNIAVALGNAPKDPQIAEALRSRLEYPSELVREHVEWALERQNK